MNISADTVDGLDKRFAVIPKYTLNQKVTFNLYPGLGKIDDKVTWCSGVVVRVCGYGRSGSTGKYAWLYQLSSQDLDAKHYDGALRREYDIKPREEMERPTVSTQTTGI